ncbi:MAG: ABC transporter substrate-binding protein [Desulfatirhabdiaceae bacterium]
MNTSTNLPRTDTPKPVAPLLKPDPNRVYRVGLSYFGAAPIYESAIAGFCEKMTQLGFREGANFELTAMHANGDISFLPQVTRVLMEKKPDVLVVMSTPALASAIALKKDVNIVFGIVSAPFDAGAGTGPDDHLPNVTGVRWHAPLKEFFSHTRTLFPHARRIGTLHNPSEANSFQIVADLRNVLPELGMELIAVSTHNAGEISENIHALLGKDIDLFYIIGDNTVLGGMPTITNACIKNNIPMLAADRSRMGTGAIMSFGPGPYSEGMSTAEVTSRVLLGESPKDIPISSGKDMEMSLDFLAVERNSVQLSPEFVKQVDIFYNLNKLYKRPAKISLISLVNNSSLAEAEQGIELGLQERGLKPEIDYAIKKFNAQGEIGLLSQIIQAAVSEKPDMIVTVTTPALMAVSKQVKSIPVVFTVASDPAKLKLFSKGPPANICGVYDQPPIDILLDMAVRHNPGLTSVGIVYDAAQDNSLISVEHLRSAAKNRNMRVLEATASMVSDLHMATESVIQRGAGAIIISADNLATTGFSSIHKVAAGANVPIYVTDMDLMNAGATGGAGIGYLEWGKQSGRMAATALAGVSPGELPIEPCSNRIIVEPDRGK